ncbi:MAG: Ig-like domain-containing protein [Lachnospiraceae bacterium]|nr:Ig-like domain-containing protein [Lachnospiraceae bacterium]
MRFFRLSVLSFLSFCLLLAAPAASAQAIVSDPLFVTISDHDIELDIGDQYRIFAFMAGTGKIKWTSSSSKIASVSNGVVTAKKAGTAKIMARSGESLATCTVTVRKTVIETDIVRLTLERGDRYRIRFSTSNGHVPSFKTSKSSVATVDDTGTVTAFKPGEAVITLKCDGSEKSVFVTVKKPDIKLNRTEIKLYPGEMFKLNAKISSKAQITWKSGKSRVAKVDHEGRVIAAGPGSAIISVSADGASAFCVVTVLKPKIKLSKTELDMKVGESFRPEASVTPNCEIAWSVSNEKILAVDEDGTIKALKKGKAYVYAKAGGAKEKCLVTVSEP